MTHNKLLLCRNLLFLSGTLFFAGCEKQAIQKEQGSGEFASAAPASTMAPAAAPYSSNVLFNSTGYNQFVSDLTNNSTAVNALFNTEAEAALNHTPTAYASILDDENKLGKANGDGHMVTALALKALSITSSTTRAPYVNKAAEILKAWAAINVQCWHRPQEASSFLRMYEGYSLVRSLMTTADKTAVDTWIRNRATSGSFNFSLQDGNTVNKTNNWEAMRLVFRFYTAYILGDATMLSTSKTEYNTLHNTFYKSNGETTDFQERDAFAYQQYGLMFMGYILRAMHANEGSSVTNTYRDRVNSSGGSMKKAIGFWEVYLCGKYHDEFKNSIYSSERNGPRRGRFSPTVGVYVMDVVVHPFGSKMWHYINLLSSNKTRFANRERYFSTVQNAAGTGSTGTANVYGLCSWGGYNVGLSVGGYRPSSMQSSGIADNTVSGISASSSRRVVIFDGDYYDATTAGGTSYTVSATNVSCLSSTYDNKTGSIIVVTDF